MDGTIVDDTEITAGLFHLRPPRESEAAEVLALAKDPDVDFFTQKLRGVTDLELARAECRKWADWTDQVTFSILDSTTEEYLGHVGLFGFDLPNSSAEIGYRVVPAARGRGAATTAVRAVTGWGFAMLALERITLLHIVENEASCRVADKAGYLLEGTLRSEYRAGDGKLHDSHIHARLATD